ncbi:MULTISPECIES: DUF1501 domain-containing protein [unclassified Nocardioides]|uniref:DUF1501 domain-containing protein n=1 Tax=unclassified Nocardioides TaxID=2615069 RepID=UPI0009F02350|nr:MULTISPECIES: DUF1501 domain-containing protein [unclassified Nocardioides]GAW48458.1 uncharacterized protein (Precursor) [Nocardioides sp. PD653-B2]GAW53383.1 uncharacterized protein (Precursor) [Nocardioides sp. PD653]
MTRNPCCDEFARLSRRSFLGGSVALVGATTIVGSAAITTSAAALTSAPSVLVVLSLRGAADGLSLVVPHGDPVYYDARPRIAVPSDRLLAKDGMFGLHPQLAPLLPLWTAGRLAAVQATGLPAPNRSHFSAMEEVEDADPGSTKRSGWLNRLIGTDASTSPLQGFNAAGGVVPTSLYGAQPVMSAGSIDSVEIPGDDKWDVTKGRRSSLHTLWDRESGPLGTAMRSMFGALDDFAPVKESVDNQDSYPDSDLGRALSEVARVIRGDVGVEVITVDQGDWDMHSDMGSVENGWMSDNAQDLAGSVAAFFGDLGTQAAKVTLVTISEFGRRVVENASNGLDHGYGNVMLVAGAGVKGGRYYGTWTPLTDDVDSDLLVTTDYRSVLAEIVSARFGASTAAVFPHFAPESVGVMTSL